MQAELRRGILHTVIIHQACSTRIEFELGHSIAEPSSEQNSQAVHASRAIHQYISSQTILYEIYFQDVQGQKLLGPALCAQC
jgi:hypothetical protein